ncbi:hypothetical protein [Roseicyclus persicicus]|uniref:Uncharacterized protein n=1 Tax=Roseicyclus persicicus TaxID=2650661 RepID=A0A7X6GX93_9RHOB|nr:hypothetical protein [Roseibacterium persicicum]NKX43998.1 hypothetical protein [Roseibacterium persicicum]
MFKASGDVQAEGEKGVPVMAVAGRRHGPGPDCHPLAEDGAKIMDGIVAELAPSTSLEASYAEDIADVAAQICRQKSMRDASYRSLGQDVVWRRVRHLRGFEGKRVEVIATSLARGWFNGEQEAIAELDGMGLSTDVILAAVHLANQTYFREIDLSIERLERRRQRLLEEYHHLKKSRLLREQVEDAEVVSHAQRTQ